MATLSEIYNWFMTGKKPSQAQFWASWGSFWNKGESIPQSAISNLTTVLNAKAETSQLVSYQQKILKASAVYNFNIPDAVVTFNSQLKEGYIIESAVFSIKGFKIDRVFPVDGSEVFITNKTGSVLTLRHLFTFPDAAPILFNLKNIISNSVNVPNNETVFFRFDAVNSQLVELHRSWNDPDAAIEVLQQEVNGLMSQIEIDSSGNISDSWHGKTIIFTTNSTQTVPKGGLREGFWFRGIVGEDAVIETVLENPKMWYGPYQGQRLIENSYFIFIQFARDDNYVGIYGHFFGNTFYNTDAKTIS